MWTTILLLAALVFFAPMIRFLLTFIDDKDPRLLGHNGTRKGHTTTQQSWFQQGIDKLAVSGYFRSILPL